jgi:hypothetical protein
LKSWTILVEGPVRDEAFPTSIISASVR